MNGRRLTIPILVAAGISLAAAAVLGWPPGEGGAPAPAARSTPAPATAAARSPSLYCEFYNVTGRTPKVGFSFAVEHEDAGAAYAQIFRREMSGEQTDLEGADRPLWAFDESDDPATLHSPDGAIQINLYGDRPKPGSHWFEAGLRSVQYLNREGKCRRSAA